MPLIKIRTLVAGPHGCFQPDSTHNLSEAIGQPLVDGGAAVWIVPKVKKVERAVIAPQETAVAPAQKRGRR